LAGTALRAGHPVPPIGCADGNPSPGLCDTACQQNLKLNRRNLRTFRKIQRRLLEGWLATGLIVPRGHWLAARRAVALRETADETFVAYKPRLATRELTHELCRRAGFTPHITFEGEEGGQSADSSQPSSASRSSPLPSRTRVGPSASISPSPWRVLAHRQCREVFAGQRLTEGAKPGGCSPQGVVHGHEVGAAVQDVRAEVVAPEVRRDRDLR
jgi:hypothetical protein